LPKKKNEGGKGIFSAAVGGVAACCARRRQNAQAFGRLQERRKVVQVHWPAKIGRKREEREGRAYAASQCGWVGKREVAKVFESDNATQGRRKEGEKKCLRMGKPLRSGGKGWRKRGSPLYISRSRHMKRRMRKIYI